MARHGTLPVASHEQWEVIGVPTDDHDDPILYPARQFADVAAATVLDGVRDVAKVLAGGIDDPLTDRGLARQSLTAIWAAPVPTPGYVGANRSRKSSKLPGETHADGSSEPAAIRAARTARLTATRRIEGRHRPSLVSGTSSRP